MAGDWIAIDHETFAKNEVLSMAALLGIPPAAVVGGLAAIWCWFDAHACHGRVMGVRDTSVTLTALDALAGASGAKSFTGAMQEVGWLKVAAHGLAIPDWEAHFGKSSKERALARRRQRDWRRDRCHGAVTQRRDSAPATEQNTNNTPPNPPAGGGRSAVRRTSRDMRLQREAERDRKLRRLEADFDAIPLPERVRLNGGEYGAGTLVGGGRDYAAMARIVAAWQAERGPVRKVVRA